MRFVRSPTSHAGNPGSDLTWPVDRAACLLGSLQAVDSGVVAPLSSFKVPRRIRSSMYVAQGVAGPPDTIQKRDEVPALLTRTSSTTSSGSRSMNALCLEPSYYRVRKLRPCHASLAGFYPCRGCCGNAGRRTTRCVTSSVPEGSTALMARLLTHQAAKCQTGNVLAPELCMMKSTAQEQFELDKLCVPRSQAPSHAAGTQP